LGDRKDIHKKIKPKLRYLFLVVGLGSLLAFFYVKAVSPPQKDEPSSARASSVGPLTKGPVKAGPASPAKSPSRKPSLLRIDLLENLALSRGENSAAVSRSIFQPLTPPGAALSKKKEDRPKDLLPVEPAKPKIHVKLVGIMGKKADAPQAGLIKYAVLSFEGEIVIVKKGDVIIDQFEVLEVGEETVDILVKETGQVEKLSLEKSAR
jgi:hypothetical protein